MAVGRISGPLLAQNLFRDDVPLAFYNTSSSQLPVLFLDVTNGFVGIRKDVPSYSLDVAGIINTDILRVVETTTGTTGFATIGKMFFSSSTISTTVGPLRVQPSGNDAIILESQTTATQTVRFAAGIDSVSSATGSVVIEGALGLRGRANFHGTATITGGLNSTLTTNGQLVIDGGVGISKDLRVGGIIYGIIATSTIAQQAIVADSVFVTEDNNGVYYPTLSNFAETYGTLNTNFNFRYSLTDKQFLASNITVTTSTTGDGTFTVEGASTFIGQVFVTNATTSTTSTEGALVITGGVGIGGDLNVQGNIKAVGNIQLGDTTSTDVVVFEAEVASDIYPSEDNTYSLGSPTNNWAEAYVNTLYSSVIASQQGGVTINPANNVLEINANIRANGTMPIGTAPVITNILYVNTDGSDTNDGRAADASRACRTIGGAIRSPYYGPGTSIHVASGHYRENNPLVMQQYTSIVGNDLRTTFIEPINKTQDIFHVQSGCYVVGLTFINGRSGVLPGQYTKGTNRGAYAVAYPPQVGGTKIDVFHSPYVQNCTNQSGPWLKDGTMFVPNQTVQVPTAVGTGTWAANTTTIDVYVSDGTIDTTMAANAGQQNPGFFNARTLLLANKPFIQEQVVAYVNQTYPSFEYSQAKCFRDVGIILENVAYDSAFGGNEKSIEAGSAYYNGVISLIAGQETQTIAAINYIDTLSQLIITNSTAPDLLSSTGLYSQVINISLIDGAIMSDSVTANLGIITTIINSGTSYAPPLYKSTGPDAAFVSAEILLEANRTFIQTDVIAWITNTYPSFTYNQAVCYRDVGLIVDAVSQDILLGGNSKTLEAALSYWEGGYSQIVGQVSTTTQAITHARDISLQVIGNIAVSPQLGNTSTQVINTYFKNGDAATLAVQRNFDLINTVIIGGPAVAPPRFEGSSLFALTGINGNDIRLAPRVTSVTPLSGNLYTVTLSTATVGHGTNATLYFGETSIFPKQDADVPETWAQRRVDTLGAMGGMLVDGGVVSDRSPIASMVLNAYTQVSQGGKGIHIINNGYAQLVSIFTIFCNVAVECDNGGIASITNSNSNFGDVCLLSKGYGEREFSGTLYNPGFPTNVPNGQFYPSGYWPQNGQVLAYVPDSANRPHISLIMEAEPPVDYYNVQGFPGFLTAAPNTSTLTTGSITINGIDTTDIAIGQNLFVRDQFGRQTDSNGNRYIVTGTVITDVGYQTITLNRAISQGGGDVNTPTFFTLYTCGNAYYTVLSSSNTDNPVTVGDSFVSGQEAANAGAVDKIRDLLADIVANNPVPTIYSTLTQTILPLVQGGSGSISFIEDRLNTASNIILNGPGVAPAAVKTGTVPSGAGSAITLIESNIEFIAREVTIWIDLIYPFITTDDVLLARNTRSILQQLIYDLQLGGNYYSVYAGLSYWSRDNTFWVVQLGENITNPALIPDGAAINFYQRSYMSASGYTFEYVGAGMNYGSLPQVGQRDPNQSKEVVQIDNGKVFFTSTDQNGDFRIGPGLVISQATGVLSGRTFTKSLFANLTPFILAIEGGG